MQVNVALLKSNFYIKRVLRKLKVEYNEYRLPEELLHSNAALIFCDKKADVKKAIAEGKFVITNHEVLMDVMGKTAVTTKSYYYVMRDFLFGERSFLINHMVYCCDNSMDTVDEKTQQFIKNQDFIDVGLTYDEDNKAIEGACVLVGRQMISLPWKFEKIVRSGSLKLYPHYSEKKDKYTTRLGFDVDHKTFSGLLFVLLRYAYQRCELKMPDTQPMTDSMGEKEIAFIYPHEEYMSRWRKGIDEKRKRYMLVLSAIFATAMISLNCLFNIRSLPNIYPLYKSSAQTRYMADFMKEQLYPDAFLQLLVKDKSVIMHDSGDEYEHPVYPYIDEATGKTEYANSYDPRYYYGRDYYRYFSLFSEEVIIDDSVPVKDEVLKLNLTEQMTCLGYANDMQRYVFLLNEDQMEQASYFWYDYVYRNDAAPMYIYLENDIKVDCSDIVALWDTQNNLYIMSREYYEKEVKSL